MHINFIFDGRKNFFSTGEGGKMKIKEGTIKVKKCKITGRRVKMYFTGDLTSERGENGHKGWLCLHRGR